jgi:hypothetical protein
MGPNSMNLQHQKATLQLMKIKAQLFPKTSEERLSLVNNLLDISYENPGSLPIKLQVKSILQKLFDDYSEESRIRFGLAYSIYYIVVDSNFSYQERGKALDSFKDLFTWFDLDEAVLSLYGRAIENFIRDISFDNSSSRKLLERIKNLHEEFPHCDEVTRFLSSSIFQMHSSEMRDPKRQLEMLRELKSLYEKFKEDQSISLDYGIALHNSARSPYLSEDERISLIEDMGAWQAIHKPDDWLLKSLSVWHAGALNSWSDLPVLRRKVVRLAVQHVERLHEHDEVREEFTDGASRYLLQQINLQSEERLLIKMLDRLRIRYPDDENAHAAWNRALRAIALAEESLVDLSRQEAIALLQESAAKGIESSEALYHLTWTLTMLVESSSLEETERATIEKDWSQLEAEYSDQTSFRSSQAAVYLVLFGKSLSSENPSDDYFEKIKGIFDSAPDDEISIATYADVLMTACSYSYDPICASNRLKELKNLQKKHPKNTEVLDLLATALSNLFRYPYEGLDQSKVQEDLQKLAKKYPKNETVASVLSYVLAAGYLGSLDRKILRSIFFADLKDLAQKMPDTQEVQDNFVSSLVFASILAKSPSEKKKLLAEVEARNPDRVLEDFPVLIPLLPLAREFHTLSPEEIRGLLARVSESTDPD